MAAVDKFVRDTDKDVAVYFTRAHLLNKTKAPGYVISSRDEARNYFKGNMWTIALFGGVIGGLMSILLRNWPDPTVIIILLLIFFLNFVYHERRLKRFEGSLEKL